MKLEQSNELKEIHFLADIVGRFHLVILADHLQRFMAGCLGSARRIEMI